MSLQVPSSRPELVGYAAAAAWLSHLWFKRHEPNINYLFVSFLVAQVILPSYILPYLNPESLLFYHFSTTGLLDLTYLSVITLSIFIYRATGLHPLSHIPGPLGAKLSKIWGSKHSTTGEGHRVIQGLHQRYGDVVRIGPNEISINSVSAVPTIYHSNLIKGPMFEARFEPETHLHNTIDIDIHTKRRRVWEHALNARSLAAYEPTVKGRAEELVEELLKRTKENGEKGGRVADVDFAKWAAFFAWDVMMDLSGLGAGDSMLASTAPSTILSTLKATQVMFNTLLNLPWLGPFLRRVPTFGADKEFKEFCTGRLDKRRTEKRGNKDIFNHLLGEEREEGTKLTPGELAADTLLIVIAGSDTTTTTLAFAMYYLACNPSWLVTLQKELDEACASHDVKSPIDLPAQALARLPYLNAVINESLRLNPPVPSGLQRIAPAGGITISGYYIPEGTHVGVHTYTLHRDPRCFSSPNAFRPDRWLEPVITTKTDSTPGPDARATDKPTCTKQAFMPFSVGTRSCVGKNLALQELRLSVSGVVDRFDVRLKDGFDKEKFERGYLDYFTGTLGELWLRFSVREKGAESRVQ